MLYMKDANLFDLIVIGTGTAGTTVASKCSSKGLKVAIIDSLPFGGTCALRGCEPKKILVEATKTIDASQRHKNKGISGTDNIQINWSELIKFKRTFTDPFPKQREDSYIDSGITIFHGHAKFIGSDTVMVEYKEKNNNDNDILKGKHIVIATGAKPANLHIQGSENIITSDQFLGYESNQLPDNIVFIGGGYISFEFAHIAARSGVRKITILHRGKRPLGHFDPELVDQLLQESKEMGIDVKLETSVEKVEKLSSLDSHNGKLTVHYSNATEQPLSDKSSSTTTTMTTTTKSTSRSTIKADMVVHGAGRVPNIEGLDLITGKVEHTSKGIKVNEYLQSISNPIVYAAGDSADSGAAALTPAASYDGNIVSNNILNGNVTKSSYNGLPSVAFTIPPIASVGLMEKDAKEQGLQFKTNYKDTSNWYSSRRMGGICSGFKILIEKKSDKILGAHLLGPHSEEVINIFSIAIRLGLTSKDLNDPILYAYPTGSSDVVYML